MTEVQKVLRNFEKVWSPWWAGCRKFVSGWWAYSWAKVFYFAHSTSRAGGLTTTMCGESCAYTIGLMGAGTDDYETKLLQREIRKKARQRTPNPYHSIWCFL